MARYIESDSQTFHQMLDEALNALDKSGVPYALMGGIAATALGGHRFTHDIDIFVRPGDAETVLQALEQAGFLIERTDPKWLYKAFKSNVMVDIIFKSSGPVFLDDEIIEHSILANFNGRAIRTVGPEDLIVIKSLVLSEHSLSLDEHCTRHLNDILGIIRVSEIDWDYLIKRSRAGPRRILSLLLYAQSLDLLVPNRVVRDMVRLLELC